MLDIIIATINALPDTVRMLAPVYDAIREFALSHGLTFFEDGSVSL